MNKDKLKMILGVSGGPSKNKSMKTPSIELEDEVSDDESEMEDERSMTAQAILDAIKSNDASALDLALEDHYKACESSESESEVDDESEYEDDMGDD